MAAEVSWSDDARHLAWQLRAGSGQVQVHGDRKRLETSSCECYRVVKTLFDSLQL